jgi:hypothetical protein
VIDLERNVREVLEGRADEAGGRGGQGMPAEMQRQVRRRQARTVVMSGLAAALVALGALAGARALVPSASREPGTGPPTSPFPMRPNPPMTVFASGEFRGLDWKFSAGRDRDIWCVEVEARTERSGESMGSCERNALQDRHLVATALYSPGFPAVFVSGFVSADVDRVVFDFDAGARVEGSVYPTPKEMKAPFNAFFIVVPQDRPARGLVLAFDAEGNVLGRHGVYEPLGFFEAEDTYGNAVGYLQPQALDHGLAWAKPGSEATIDGMRETAARSLTRIWPEVRGWWEERPPADAPDDAFLDWWASYPVTGPRINKEAKGKPGAASGGPSAYSRMPSRRAMATASVRSRAPSRWNIRSM